jgi:carbon storage regulator CsrA
MLVLSRKSGETIVIDNNIQIVVLEVRGSQVKLGVQAPPEVAIRRAELNVNSLHTGMTIVEERPVAAPSAA